jgi:hypothetical protein
MNSPLPLRHPERTGVESIRRAAVMANEVCFSLSPPANHARILEWIKELGSQANAPVLGFITNKNRFVTAAEARSIAREAGQGDEVLLGVESPAA